MDVFKVEILPIIKLISCLLVHAFFVLIMAGMYLIAGMPVRVTWIQDLYYTFAASVLALGLGYFTASVNVFFKDMAQIVGICLQFGIWLSPIMYHESMFTDRMPWMEPIFKLNPFYYIVTGYKDSMITGNWFWERPKLTLYYWAFTLIVLLCGLKMFKKLRPPFSCSVSGMIGKIGIGWRQGEREGTIEAQVVYSRRRSLALEIKTDGQVIIRAPGGHFGRSADGVCTNPAGMDSEEMVRFGNKETKSGSGIST